jgi:hypothetical protein
MPKGSLIFAPILLKRVFGANALSLTGADVQMLAAKAGASLLLWITIKTVMKLRN